MRGIWRDCGVLPAVLLMAILARPVHCTVTPPSGAATAVTNSVEVLGCPSDIFLYAESEDPGERSVSWTPPHPPAGAASDDIIRTSTHCPGSFFPVGRTVVLYTYLLQSESRIQATCRFEVTFRVGPIGLTDYTYFTQAQASAECQRTDQHLCYRWEIEDAIGKGYPLSTPEGAWYADLESHAVLSDTEVTYRGLQLPVPARSPGLCCSRPVYPFITPQSYDLADRDGQANGCSSLAAHLCTLAELLKAYQSGYRSEAWLYFTLPNRDVKVGACSGYHYGSECFSGGLIPNTPRPYTRAQAYCCPDRG